jgi:hypothetical protein
MSSFHTAVLFLFLSQTKCENSTAGSPRKQLVDAPLYVKKWLMINIYRLCDSKCSWFNGRIRECGF